MDIGDNIRQVLETIEYYEISGTPGLVFIADFEKAFDKVRMEFILYKVYGLKVEAEVFISLLQFGDRR